MQPTLNKKTITINRMLLFFAIFMKVLFSVSPHSPLKPLLNEMRIVENPETTGTIEVQELTRVDETIDQQPLTKIKDLLPKENVFNTFYVSPSSILKLLSTTQTEKVMEMMAKGSYVRYDLVYNFCFRQLNHINLNTFIVQEGKHIEIGRMKII